MLAILEAIATVCPSLSLRPALFQILYSLNYIVVCRLFGAQQA